MEKFARLLLKHRAVVCGIFLVAMATSLCMLPLSQVNYDMTEYLPEQSMSKQAISVLEKEFSYPGIADVMVSGLSVEQALVAKAKIAAVPGVKSVMWLDDMTDTSVPVDWMDSALVDKYYKDNNALFTVEFTGGNFDVETGKAIDAIRETFPETGYVRGMAEDGRNMQNSMTGEIFTIMIIVFPLCIIILMLASNSYIEPFLYLLVIGVSIVLNSGTNALFNNVSYVTFSISAVLQMAISMDYSLFLSHRYIEERDNGLSVVESIVKSVTSSFSSIAASACTTFAGFMALLFMGYSLGADLGLVLAKGIVLSFISVICLMPVLLAMCSKIIEKTRHRSFLPSFGGLGKIVVKFRYIILAVAVVIAIPSFLAQNKNDFLYGADSAASVEGMTAVDRMEIEKYYGVSNPIILLTPKDSIENERQVSGDLLSQKYIKNVTSLASVLPEGLPVQMLPEEAVSQFRSENYSRYILELTVGGENAQAFAASDEIETYMNGKYGDKWLAAGSIMSTKDIKNTVENDTAKVSWISILAVGFIVMLTFKGVALPVILVLVIQTSVWANMSFPYFGGTTLVYLGYLIVSAIQLGATIDYGILICARYTEYRKTMSAKESALGALKSSGSSVLVSALILAVAGFTLGMISQMSAVADIGILLGRGATLSGAMVLIVLPAALMIFDKLISVTTLKRGK